MKTQVKFLSGLRVGEISKHTSKPETPTGKKKKKDGPNWIKTSKS